MRSALQLSGVLAFDPEPIPAASQALCFVFLRTGDADSIPQEVLIEGQAALEAQALRRGDRVRLACNLQRGLWRAVELEVLEAREADREEEELVAAFA